MSECKTIDQEIEELEDGIKKEFYDEVLVSLGGSLVDVELSLKDFMIAFKKEIGRASCRERV